MKVYGLKCKNPGCNNVFIIGREEQPRSEWVQPFGRQAQQCNVCHLNATYHYEDVRLLEIRETLRLPITSAGVESPEAE
jgi:hypothetical protein